MGPSPAARLSEMSLDVKEGTAVPAAFWRVNEATRVIFGKRPLLPLFSVPSRMARRA